MTKSTSGRVRALYAGFVIAVIVATAVLRRDLAIQEIENAWELFSRGGLVRWQVAGLAVLFVTILSFTTAVVSRRADPRRDLLAVIGASAAGWIVEAWGTRLGLWTYFTNEAPPLWIVPAWPLGALFIDRASFFAQRHATGFVSPRAARRGYWLVAALALLFVGALAWPTRTHPWTIVMILGLAGGLVALARPERDVWVLVTGLGLVFFADFWGTESSCWRYWWQEPGARAPQLAGVATGMLGNSAIVLIVWKTVRAIAPPP